MSIFNDTEPEQQSWTTSKIKTFPFRSNMCYELAFIWATRYQSQSWKSFQHEHKARCEKWGGCKNHIYIVPSLHCCSRHWPAGFCSLINRKTCCSLLWPNKIFSIVLTLSVIIDQISDHLSSRLDNDLDSQSKPASRGEPCRFVCTFSSHYFAWQTLNSSQGNIWHSSDFMFFNIKFWDLIIFWCQVGVLYRFN